MTRDEVKAILARITGETSDEAILSDVETILNGWDNDSANQLAEANARIAALESELNAEKERFKNRFWNGDGGQAMDRSRDYGNMEKEDIIEEFFKGV